jgi:hypothetical protein
VEEGSLPLFSYFLNQKGEKGMVKKRKMCPLRGAKEAF